MERIVCFKVGGVDPGAAYGLTFRGLFGMIVLSVRATLCSDWTSILPRFEVALRIEVPDRDDPSVLREINFADEFQAMPHHTDRGMTPEQSCIVQAIHVVWEHELGESVLANGAPVWDPEPAHRGA